MADLNSDLINNQLKAFYMSCQCSNVQQMLKIQTMLIYCHYIANILIFHPFCQIYTKVSKAIHCADIINHAMFWKSAIIVLIQNPCFPSDKSSSYKWLFFGVLCTMWHDLQSVSLFLRIIISQWHLFAEAHIYFSITHLAELLHCTFCFSSISVCIFQLRIFSASCWRRACSDSIPLTSLVPVLCLELKVVDKLAVVSVWQFDTHA